MVVSKVFKLRRLDATCGLRIKSLVKFLIPNDASNLQVHVFGQRTAYIQYKLLEQAGYYMFQLWFRTERNYS